MELIGYCPVDSGQLMLIDPCYVFMEHHKQENFDTIYEGICNKTCYEPFGGTFDVGFPESGTAVSTGWGDGIYPVYVKRDKHDRIMKVIVDFGDDEDEEES